MGFHSRWYSTMAKCSIERLWVSPQKKSKSQGSTTSSSFASSASAPKNLGFRASANGGYRRRHCRPCSPRPSGMHLFGHHRRRHARDRRHARVSRAIQKLPRCRWQSAAAFVHLNHDIRHRVPDTHWQWLLQIFSPWFGVAVEFMFYVLCFGEMDRRSN